MAENVLARQFQVETINAVWLSDITYVPTDEGWRSLAVVMDLASRKIMGWSMQETLEREIVLDAYQMALAARHSDQGVQYASGDTQQLLSATGIKPICFQNEVAVRPLGRHVGPRGVVHRIHTPGRPLWPADGRQGLPRHEARLRGLKIQSAQADFVSL